MADFDQPTIVNGKIYQRCCYCGKIIRINKPLVGSIHVCLTDEEIAELRRGRTPWIH